MTGSEGFAARQDSNSDQGRGTLVCFSHLRWGFVFQRPQHLMSRFAKQRRVFFIEEATYDGQAEPVLNVNVCPKTNVIVATPRLPEGTGPDETRAIVARLIRRLFRDKKIQDYIAWYYTPMALDYSRGLKPKAAVYDCMDELSLFRNAPEGLLENERRLLRMS